MPSFDHKVPPVAENTKALLLTPKHTYTHPCRLKNSSDPVPLQQHLSIYPFKSFLTLLLLTMFSNRDMFQFECVYVCGMWAKPFAKLSLFILTEHTQCCGFSHNLTGKWHHLLLTLMMNRTIPQSGYNVAMDSLRTVCKFITALWYHRITVVEIAFTSAEFTASFL